MKNALYFFREKSRYRFIISPYRHHDEYSSTSIAYILELLLDQLELQDHVGIYRSSQFQFCRFILPGTKDARYSLAAEAVTVGGVLILLDILAERPKIARRNILVISSTSNFLPQL